MTKIVPAYPDVVENAEVDKPLDVEDEQARQLVRDGLARYPERKTTTEKKEQG